jgi:hypothetical protein
MIVISKRRYMLLCKIMMNKTEDVTSIINSKGGLKFVGVDTEAMKAVAAAHITRSLSAFQEALQTYKPQLGDDPVIETHLKVIVDRRKLDTTIGCHYWMLLLYATIGCYDVILLLYATIVCYYWMLLLDASIGCYYWMLLLDATIGCYY